MNPSNRQLQNIHRESIGLVVKTEAKKILILDAAEKILSQRGLADTKISEIAQEAQVAVSVIYQHFKGKEDLVFSIVGRKMREILLLLDEHLQGIKDAESRLGKMIWFYLRFNEMNPGYARIFLLDCVFSKEFYASAAYDLVRQYASILLDILKQGVKERSFRSDIDIRIVRDVILGFLGCEVFMYSALGEMDSCVPDFEAVLSLVSAMITAKAEPHLSKAEIIMMAAEKIFSEKGFMKATISEIATGAQVAEGTVYEYFENKEKLLLSISEKRLEEYQKQLPNLFHIKDPMRKLRRFIRYFFSAFFSDRDFLKVFLLEVQLSFRFLGSKALDLFKDYFQIIEEIIEEGKSKGSFRPDVDARVFRNMLIGTFNNLTLRWFILDRGNQTDKMEKIDRVTDLLCSSVEKIQEGSRD